MSGVDRRSLTGGVDLEVMLRWSVVLLSLVFVLAFLVIGVSHVAYPYEIDWYEGIVLDHSARLLDGKLFYVQPTHEFVAALYQPLYQYLAAAIMTVAGEGYFAGRIISLIGTLGTSILLAAWAKKLTNNWLASFAVVGLFLAAYDITGYNFTLARIDGLLVLELVLIFWLTSRVRSVGGAVGIAALGAIAFFTKQQAVFYFPFIAIWLYFVQRQAGIAFVAACAVFLAAGVMFMQSVTDGWYSFYVFDVPRAKSGNFGWVRTLTLIPQYLLRYWGVGMALLLLYLGTSKLKLRSLASSDGLILLFFLASVLQSAMHRGDQISYTNVYIPLAATSALVIVLAVFRLMESGMSRQVVTGALALQLIAMLYDPRQEPKILVNASLEQGDSEFVEAIRREPGEVKLLSHGFMSRLAGKSIQAVGPSSTDVQINAGEAAEHLKRDLDSAYRSQKYSLILLDSSIFAVIDSIPGYTYAGEFAAASFGSRVGAHLTFPKYMFRPKTP